MFGELVSPLGNSEHLRGELSLLLEPQPDKTEQVKPPLGCPTGQDEVTGTNGCSSVPPCSRSSVPPAPPGMISSHYTLILCQEPNSDLGCAALSPGTLVPHCCEQPEQTRAVCRAAAGMLAPSPARCRAGGSHPVPIASRLPPAPQPQGKGKASWQLVGREGLSSQISCSV